MASSLPEQPPQDSSSSEPSSARSHREIVLPRLSLSLRVLCILSLCCGVWGAFFALADVNTALLLDRNAFVFRTRDRELMLFDQLKGQLAGQLQKDPQAQDLLHPLVAPFLKLPRPEAERLSLLLGDALYDRRGVTVPLGLLQLILSWLLISGSLATLRRQAWGLSTWSFGCWANMFFALLDMLVTFVHSRTLMERLGQPVAQALAQASGHTVELELAGLWQTVRLYVVLRAAVDGFWVLVLGLSALCLQRLLHLVERAQARERSQR